MMSRLQRNDHRSTQAQEWSFGPAHNIHTNICIYGGDLRDIHIIYIYTLIFVRSTRSVFYDRQIILENPSTPYSK